MHPDRKIGFALGILLVGVVAALFFRNEPLREGDVPGVRREAELNRRLRERDVAVFLDEESPAAAHDGPRDNEPQWTMPELIDDLAQRASTVPNPIDPASRAAGDGAGRESPDASRRPLPPLFRSGDTPDPAQATRRPSANDAHASAPPESPSPDPSGSESAVATPSDLELPPDAYDEYVVEYGDTLSAIAERFLGSPHRYDEIYEINRDRLPEPDRLRVGSALRIPRH